MDETKKLNIKSFSSLRQAVANSNNSVFQWPQISDLIALLFKVYDLPPVISKRQ